MNKLKYNIDIHQLYGTFVGKLDTRISQDFQPVLELEIEKCQANNPDEKLKICFDFEKVDFITSTFIRICVESVKKIGKENFCVINTNPLIKKTLKIAGLDEELNVS